MPPVEDFDRPESFFFIMEIMLLQTGIPVMTLPPRLKGLGKMSR